MAEGLRLTPPAVTNKASYRPDTDENGQYTSDG
jgi:hypothetical protein